LPLHNSIIISVVNTGGDLWLLWDHRTLINELERSFYFIFVEVKKSEINQGWILGAIYGDAHKAVNKYI
jgi:hypothetical protein